VNAVRRITAGRQELGQFRESFRTGVVGPGTGRRPAKCRNKSSVRIKREVAGVSPFWGHGWCLCQRGGVGGGGVNHDSAYRLRTITRVMTIGIQFWDTEVRFLPAEAVSDCRVFIWRVLFRGPASFGWFARGTVALPRVGVAGQPGARATTRAPALAWPGGHSAWVGNARRLGTLSPAAPLAMPDGHGRRAKACPRRRKP